MKLVPIPATTIQDSDHYRTAAALAETLGKLDSETLATVMDGLMLAADDMEISGDASDAADVLLCLLCERRPDAMERAQSR